MKVLVPIHKEEVFIREVLDAYLPYCDVSTDFDAFWLVKGDFDIIHLHWPEYLVKHRVPTDIELLLLEATLESWSKKGAKIVVTRHNLKPHKLADPAFDNLYELVYKHATAVVHMGDFSMQDYQKRFSFSSSQKQLIILHPIFTQYPNTVSREESRKWLDIPESSLVVLVFGKVRNHAEKNFVLHNFDRINRKNKILLVPGWTPAKGKEPINRFTWFKVQHSKKYRISNEFIDQKDVQYYFNAADMVYLPRLSTLNSGIPYLAAVFNLPIIGHKTGNITELLAELDMPILDGEIDINRAIEKISHKDGDLFADIREKSSAVMVGKSYYHLFKELIQF
ncbi:MAG TPA: hypothetical protein DDY13_14425 [Cytophagales bacterium]|jgi:hypothetical protein|nr:hypothetical protein [Cytophagales bacterium]